MNAAWSVFVCLCIPARITLAGYFWHISDIHIDPYYNEWGPNAVKNSCNKDVSATQGRYGDYECDSPFELLRSAIYNIILNGREPAFIVWSGDTPPHPKDSSWLDTKAVLDIIKNCTQFFQNVFDNPPIPFVLSLGNHDYYPVDQLPGEENFIYEAVYNLWQPWLNSSDIKETFLRGAYYSMVLSGTSPTLRVMVANTNLYKSNNNAVSGDDPAGQFIWMEDTLGQARRNGEKVHLITHIPPGVLEIDGSVRWFKAEYNKRFIKIIIDYADVIIGSYSTQQHFDTFRIFYDKGQPVSSMFISPSLTPWTRRVGNNTVGKARNPAIRKITFDDRSFGLRDVVQYFMDLPDANEQDQSNWKQLYTFIQIYKVNNISTSELHWLVEQFRGYGNNKFHFYHIMNTVRSSRESCSCRCKYQHICAIENVDYDDFDNCMEEVRTVTCDATKKRFSAILIVHLLILHTLSS